MAAKPTEDSPIYVQAIDFATRKHKGQVRMGGMPYIVHPVAVADIVNRWGYGRDYVVTAFFHDLLEDTDATEAEIEEIGGPAVLEAVKLLSKQKGYVMADYIAGIKGNDVARVVKAADRLHNLRCAVLAPEDFKRRYVLETLDWYTDFSPEIMPALRDLSKTMEHRLADLPLDYRQVEEWGAVGKDGGEADGTGDAPDATADPATVAAAEKDNTKKIVALV